MLPDLAPAPVPRLSVVVPIYNVARYLPACLDSLADQQLIAIEILMVDDGSTDDSARIAAAYQRQDPRFRLIQQPNGGLGCARNTGVRAAARESEYLAFVDSDDVVPPDAYRAMVASLDETGSDFATGNVHHLDASGHWQTSMFRMLAAGDRRRTHISEFRALVADRIACNKVYRRSFWNRHGFVFPEGVLYEDIPVTLPAQYLAEAVDVLSEPVYYWRVRESGEAPSITNRRTEPGACRDRVNACESVSRFLAARPGRQWVAHKRHYDRSALEMDLRTFLRVLPDGDDRYHQEFLLHANRFLGQVHPSVLRELPLELRVQWALVRRRALPELLATLTADRLRDPVRVSGRLLRHAHFPEHGEVSPLPPAERRLRRRDLRFHTPLREVTWTGGRLLVSGDAWISRVDCATRLSHVKVAQLRQVGSRRRLVLPTSPRFRPERTASSGGHSHCYDWAGYQLLVDPQRLKRRGRWEEGTWLLGIGVVASGIARLGPVNAPGGGHPAGFPPYHWVDDEVRIVLSTVRGHLALRVERVRALVTDRAWDGDGLLIRGELRDTPGDRLTLRLTAMDDGEVREYPVERQGASAFSVRVPAGDLRPANNLRPTGDPRPTGEPEPALDGRGWSTALRATASDGAVTRFSTVVREGLADAEFPLVAPEATAAELAAVAGHNGCLKLWVRPPQAVLHTVRWTPEGRLTLLGRTTAELVPGAARLVLRAAGRPEERWVELSRWEAGTFEATFAPSALPGPAGALPLRTGEWEFRLRAGAVRGPGAKARGDLDVRVDRLLAPELGRPVDTGGRRFQLRVHGGDRPRLWCHSELSAMERGNFRQRQLLCEVYRPMRQLPLREAVLYLSYNGKQCSDSPLAIHEELQHRDERLQHLWVVRDGQAQVPSGARAVRLWSSEWYEALAGSRYLVTNAHLPHWLERREGQVVVQTWHGTMLKKIGLDIEQPQFDPHYHERIRRESPHWSLLVSANRFSTPILRRAFAYQGEIIESGYPRNDRLYAPDRAERVRRLAKRLGLPPGRRVVLYAPTWRDDTHAGGGDFRLDLKLDLAEAERRLGPDHVLLVRRHSQVAGPIPGDGDGFLWDVSEYPEAADLYLAADVLVTDYSSVMFDFAHTGRPMLFFTYDLEHYRDTLRGFYFDFEQEAPGPLLRTSDEVISAVRNLDRVADAHRAAYDRFVARFCEFGDGSAARRVADRMLELGREVSGGTASGDEASGGEASGDGELGGFPQIQAPPRSTGEPTLP